LSFAGDLSYKFDVRGERKTVRLHPRDIGNTQKGSEYGERDTIYSE
jgi:hypothetical protein